VEPDVAIVPSRESDYLFLSRTQQGRLFRKHILNMGELIHPDTGQKIVVDDAFVATLRRNFADKVCDIVQAPLADKDNKHDESPDRNIGEIVDVQAAGGKVYAFLDARKHAEDVGKTLLGSSAYIALNYKNDKTNERVGPTLLHMCVTNRPYVTGLDDYEEIVAASADSAGAAILFTEAGSSDPPVPAPAPVVEPPEDVAMTKDELLAALKAEHGVDVEALQASVTDLEGKVAASATNAELAAQLTADITGQLTEAGVLKLAAGTEDTLTSKDVLGAVTELAQTNVALTGRVDVLEHREAELLVDGLVRTGHVMPAQRDTYVELKLSNATMFDKLIPDQPIVKMEHEAGVLPDDGRHETLDVNAELARLTGPGGPAEQYIKS
jgi:hypothetical protein